ncbi:hypothetical protein [Piscinibacter sakaiensis]|uniref:hypothetical protein n=1 Tax=Piscinibacter sakaiensis TaxID=1547922 RepID=UPI003AAD5943
MNTQRDRDRSAATPPEASPNDRPHDPHVTNGAEATNLPPDADMPDLTKDEPDRKIEQAKKDLDAGQVDTDLRSTPGLDAQRKDKLLKDEKNKG